MCGFIGKVGQTAGPPGAALYRARAFLDRRGPDSVKLWCSPDGQVELLHARLAIVDPGGAAHQPMTDPLTGTTVAFVGEIYNYQELRAELTDHAFWTESDTEVILAAYRRWGTSCLARFRGMFALALVDVAGRRVYLARDPIGKKPLFVAQWNDRTFFGSSVLALVAASGRDPGIDPDAASDYSTDGHVSPARSIMVNCRPVVPGEVVELTLTGARRSFRVQPAVAPPDGSDAETRLADLLRTAVARRLHNNPAPTVLLSGGVDSTVVSRLVSQQTRARALTLRSLVPLTLDERYARYAARRLQLPLTAVRVTVGRIEDEVDFALGLQDEPLGMMSFFPLALLLREVKAHGRVLLSGDGGDEVFLGYGRPEDWVGPPRGAAEDLPGIPCGPPLPDWLSGWGRRTVTHALVGHMLAKLDRASAEQGVEVRCPLLDWDVMAFARSLQPDVLFGRGTPKHLLKTQFAGWPRWFVERPKAGFTYWLRWAWALRGFGGLRERIDEEAVERWGPRLPRALRRHPASWSAGEILRGFSEVWRLLAWSAFLRRRRAATSAAAGPTAACAATAVRLP